MVTQHLRLRESVMDRYDVVVVGGSFAGLSAAMQLARAQRSVLLIDAGRPRNRFAATSHGFLGQDGVAPAQIMHQGLHQLAQYPTVAFVQAEALAAAALAMAARRRPRTS